MFRSEVGERGKMMEARLPIDEVDPSSTMTISGTERRSPGQCDKIRGAT